MGTNTIDLEKRNAIVTGGGAGLGYAISERLAQSGANVCVWDINQDAIDAAVEKLSKAGSGTMCGVVGNVADVASVKDAVKATQDKLGGIDITVNNAGISGPTRRLGNIHRKNGKKLSTSI